MASAPTSSAGGGATRSGSSAPWREPGATRRREPAQLGARGGRGGPGGRLGGPGGQRPGPAGPGRARLLTWPRLAVVGAVAAGTAVAVIVAMGIPSGGHAGSGGAAPRVGGAPTNRVTRDAVLQRAAAVATAQPEPRGDQFVYSDIVTYAPAFNPAQTRVTGHITGKLEEWQSVDGSQPNTFRATPCVIDGDPAHITPGTCTVFGGAA